MLIQLCPSLEYIRIANPNLDQELVLEFQYCPRRCTKIETDLHPDLGLEIGKHKNYHFLWYQYCPGELSQ